jgi:iron complex outermembrane receptor protein
LSLIKTLISFLFLFAALESSAQRKITGVVRTEKGAPIFGAIAVIEGTSNANLTDVNGSFVLMVEEKDETLLVSSLGFETAEILLSDKVNYEVFLKDQSELVGITVVGSRRIARSDSESPVPVDIIDVSKIKTFGTLTQLIQEVIPSFNYNKQTGSDGADHIDLATMRGLGPDQTLVLIDGKRRHQTAFVALFGTRGRGNSGTDLSAIPISAIDHIEVLRDGASAQYGSDALAGVINIVLKKNSTGLIADLGYGVNYDNKFNTALKPALGQYAVGNKFDGNTINFNGNYGVPLGKQGGFLNLSGGYKAADKTYRQAVDTSDIYSNPSALPINTTRRAFGDASYVVTNGFYNWELPKKNSHTIVYGFGGFSSKKADAYAYSRNYSSRPDRFPVDSTGVLDFVDGIMQYTPDSTEIFYNPHIQTVIRDASACIGVKGKSKKYWNWDLSSNVGGNSFHFFVDKSFNPSLGATQTHFDAGGFSFTQSTTNFLSSKEFKSIFQGLSFSYGAEFRKENYSIFAGEKSSYFNYNPLLAGGSQGFPGYQPSDAVRDSRHVFGGFVDVEVDLTKRLLLAAAIRSEKYSDFGFAHNYKIAGRYKCNEKLVVRASASTGFRAPSLQQINFSSTFTIVQGAEISEVRIAPNYSAISKAAGIPNLKQERSINLGIGFTLKPMKELKISVDAYQVQVVDRVVLSGQFSAADTTLNATLIATMNSLNVGKAQFFVNAVNTTNRGVDVVFDYKIVRNKNVYKVSFVSNLQFITLDAINAPNGLNDTEQHRETFFNDREQAFLRASAPNSKGILNLEYERDSWSIGTRVTYYGKMKLLGYGLDGTGINPLVPIDLDPSILVLNEYVYRGKFVNDLFLDFNINKLFKLEIGINNLMNIHPDFAVTNGAKQWAYNNETGGAWDAVQMGASGRFIYTKVSFNL